jgi:hypothetical protein
VSAKTPSASRKTMKQILPSFRIFSDIALLAWVAACASTQTKENVLVAAGFKVIVPKPAANQLKLKALPPDKVTMVQKNRKTYYVSPDTQPGLCRGPKTV